MPDENKQPENQQTPEQQPEIKQVQEDILPDEIKTEPEKEAIKLEELKQQYEKEKQELADETRRIKEEKETLIKRLKDNQEYISRTRNLEKTAQQDFQPPQITLDGYLEDVAKRFEDDPKEAIKKIVRDVAFDRDLERQEYTKQISEAENRAFKRILSLDPERAKIVQDIEKLDQDRPDLNNLTFEQKAEWIRRGVIDSKRNETNDKVNRERDLASDAGGGRNTQRGERLPDWVHDREVMERAKEHFASKKELADWADPVKAREMAKRMRPK